MAIRFFDMFSGIVGFRYGLKKAGGFKRNLVNLFGCMRDRPLAFIDIICFRVVK